MNISEKELQILKIIGVLIALFIVYQLLKKLGVVGGMSTSEANELNEKISQNEGFKTDLRTQKQSVLKSLSPSEQIALSKQIYNAIHFSGIGIKDGSLLIAFFKIKTKYQLSQLSKTYQSLYKTDLLIDLTKNLRDSMVNRVFGGSEAYKKIVEYTQKLPTT